MNNKINIFVEGLSHDITPITVDILKFMNYNIVGQHESNWYRFSDEKTKSLVERIVSTNPRPDVTVFCNAQIYCPNVFKEYKNTTNIPFIVLTGGEHLIEDVKKYTKYVYLIPINLRELSSLIQSAYSSDKK